MLVFPTKVNNKQFFLTRFFPDHSQTFAQYEDFSQKATNFRHFQIFQISGHPIINWWAYIAW